MLEADPARALPAGRIAEEAVHALCAPRHPYAERTHVDGAVGLMLDFRAQHRRRRIAVDRLLFAIFSDDSIKRDSSIKANRWIASSVRT